jgi:hypothetical protein
MVAMAAGSPIPIPTPRAILSLVLYDPPPTEESNCGLDWLDGGADDLAVTVTKPEIEGAACIIELILVLEDKDELVVEDMVDEVVDEVAEEVVEVVLVDDVVGAAGVLVEVLEVLAVEGHATESANATPTPTAEHQSAMALLACCWSGYEQPAAAQQAQSFEKFGSWQMHLTNPPQFPLVLKLYTQLAAQGGMSP